MVVIGAEERGEGAEGLLSDMCRTRPRDELPACRELSRLVPARVMPPDAAPGGMVPPNGVRRSIWREDNRRLGGWISRSSDDDRRGRAVRSR